MSFESPTRQFGPKGGPIFASVILLIGVCLLGLLSWAIWIDLAPQAFTAMSLENWRERRKSSRTI